MTLEELEKVPVGTILKLTWGSDNTAVDLRVYFLGINTEGQALVAIAEIVIQYNYDYRVGELLNLSDNKFPYFSR